jgi:hypothetical protein
MLSSSRQEFLDMFFIELKFHVNRSLRRVYFRYSKLLDESCQIYLSGPSSTVRTISRAIKGILLRFQLDWKVGIHSFFGNMW